MNILKLIPVFCCVLLFSCGDNEQSRGETRDSNPDTVAQHDTLVNVDTPPLPGIALSMGGDTIAPVDQSMVFYRFTKKISDNKNKKLTAKEVRARFWPMDTACDEEAAYTFRRFFVLDSLRKRGEGPDTDMGQTIVVEIREYDTIKRSPTGTWVVWTMWYESEQACPYASGTYYMLSTYDAAGKPVSTQCMGRDVGGADAPLTWCTVQTANIFSDGSFRALLCDSVGDYGDDGKITYSSIVRKTSTGMISPAGKITTVVKEIERNE